LALSHWILQRLLFISRSILAKESRNTKIRLFGLMQKTSSYDIIMAFAEKFINIIKNQIFLK